MTDIDLDEVVARLGLADTEEERQLIMREVILQNRFNAWKAQVAKDAEERAAVTDIDDALAALKADGFNHDTALRALDVLAVSGFLITRPQTLLDQLANATMETRP